jgi:murein DD-endopeptidase MepM/ murein hydrolase activator NlpD
MVVAPDACDGPDPEGTVRLAPLIDAQSGLQTCEVDPRSRVAVASLRPQATGASTAVGRTGQTATERGTLAPEVTPMLGRPRPILLAGVIAPLLGGVLATPLAARAGSPPGWGWPLPPPHHVVEGFDPPAEPWLPGQRGVDLAGHVAERVLAAGDGVVSFAGPVAGIGVVAVTSGALRTTYEPVRPLVRAGQPVRRGQLIGRLVLAGSQCLPAACLHWGLLRGTTYLDPLALLGLSQVRLLPLDPSYRTPAYP